MFGFMWTASTKWIYRLKPPIMFSTKRKANKGIDREAWEFEPKPKLAWLKPGFSVFLLFTLLAILGMLSFYAFINKSDELQEKKDLQLFNEAVNDDQNFSYLFKNADYYYLKGDFITAKNELDIALKIYPKNTDANRLYIQTMIQLAEKYPSYKDKAYELSKDRLVYLTNSNNDMYLKDIYKSFFDGDLNELP